MNDKTQFITKKLVKNISLMQINLKDELWEYEFLKTQNHNF